MLGKDLEQGKMEMKGPVRGCCIIKARNVGGLYLGGGGGNEKNGWIHFKGSAL